jgi:hypothetical protein
MIEVNLRKPLILDGDSCASEFLCIFEPALFVELIIPVERVGVCCLLVSWFIFATSLPLVLEDPI